MVALDGSHGEGGGQVLRSALALSAVTGQPFTLDRVRAGRSKPGLLRQHLTSLQAAAAVCGAQVEGAALGSQRVVFRPGVVQAGSYEFEVGSAGSANLVLQTVLPMLIGAEGESVVRVEGGTHNPASPSTDFVRRTFAPALALIGPRVEVALEQHGFFPAGGGRLRAALRPAALVRACFGQRTSLGAVRVRGLRSRGGGGAFAAAVEALGARLGAVEAVVEHVRSAGPGEVLLVEVEAEPLAMVFAGYVMRGGSWSVEAERLAVEVERWVHSGVSVDEHLADQLLLPMALAGGGDLLTTEPSLHTRTHAELIERFLPVRVGMEREGVGWRIVVG
jgi:RNA 3'-terminal phosphate cyclase (ATP)